MSKSYGTMCGCADAIAFVIRNTETRTKEDVEQKERVINRMRYEFDKDIPVPYKLSPGIYGHKYDSYQCGNCGHTLPAAMLPSIKFCYNCGFAVGGDRTK